MTFLAVASAKGRDPEVIAAFENQDSTNSEITTNTVKKKNHAIYGQSLRSRNSILSSIEPSTLMSIESFLSDIGRPPISRLDFRRQLADPGRLYFLEINTDPTLGANQ